MKDDIYVFFYHIIENIDGEKHLHIISYKLGEKIKLYLLDKMNIND